MKIKEFVDQLDDSKIKAAIQEAELKSSGEICVFIAPKKVSDPLAAAQAQFAKMGLEKTAQRNAVLFFLAPLSQQFAILGDKGVHEKCGEAFWNSAADRMSTLMQSGQFTEGLVAGITQVGTVLEQFFPRSPNDKNELPDEVVRS